MDSQPQRKQTLTTGKKGKSDGSCSDSGSKKSFHNFPKLSGGREEGEVREDRKPGNTASEVVEEQITDKGMVVCACIHTDSMCYIIRQGQTISDEATSKKTRS